MLRLSSEERLPLLHSDRERDGLPQKDEVPCRHIPARYVLTTMGFIGSIILFSIRASFSVALVAMVNSADPQAGGVSNSSVSGGHNGSTTTGEPEGDFNWDETTQGLILGAFFYGYCWPQLFFARLADRIGGKMTVAMTVLASALLTLLIPLAARAGLGAFFALRFLQGLVESGTYPALHKMLGIWSPVQERSRLANLTYLGVEIGTVVGMMTSGVLSQYGFAGGWPSIFYIHGTAGCVWVLGWMYMVFDTPDQHPHITEKEIALIAETVVHKEKMPTPWRPILTSPAVWSIVCIHSMTTWGFTSMSSMLPSYMSNILHFDIQQNGFLSSIPFVAQLAVEIVGSVALDMLHNWKVTRFSRKIFNTVGAVLTAVFFVATGYVPQDSPMLAVTLVTLGVGCSALCVCSMRVSHLDIAPRFGGTLFGLSNTFANITGFISPLVAGLLTQNQQTVEQWRIFFCINAAVYVSGALVFLVWGGVKCNGGRK